MYFSRKLLFFLLLFGLIFTFINTEPQPVYALNITVDGTTCTLTDAILAANSGLTIGGCTGSGGADTIILNTDVTLTTADTTNSIQRDGTYAGLPEITTDITIQAGTNMLIERDGSYTCVSEDTNQFRLFNVSGGGALTLDGVTLQNGCAAGNSNSYGGAIYVTGSSSLTVQDSTLTNNTVHGRDVGNWARGGAVFSVNSTVLIDNATISNNTAEGGSSSTSGGDGSGGGVYTVTGSLTIQNNTQFTSNTAQGGSATDSTAGFGFPGWGNGGGLYIATSSASITDTQFSSNSAIGGDNLTLANDGGTGYGGGVYAGANATLSNILFSNNTAQGGLGNAENGGEANGGGLYQSPSPSVTVSNSLFDGNRALGGASNLSNGGYASGGGAYLETVTNTAFRNNAAIGGSGVRGGGADGGGLRSNDTASFTYLSFTNNTALGGAGTTGNGGSAYGGGFLKQGSTTASHNMTFDGNQAIGGTSTTGSGGNAYGGGWHQILQGVTLEHTTFTNNSAIGGVGGGGNGTASGGGYSDRQLNSTTRLNNNLMANNTVTPGGGSTTPEDCAATQNPLASDGYNYVEAPGTGCTFASTGDVTGLDPSLDPIGDNGCTTTLPDGSCTDTILTSDANIVDQGSCATSGATDDQRGTARPDDLASFANADDGCDIGAVEVSVAVLCTNPLDINTDTELSACIIWANGNPGADILQINSNITLTSADTTDSTLVDGAYAGLPDVTTDITINAGTGSIIERDGSFGCVDSDPNEFRIFNVTGTDAALTLDGITVQNGCNNGYGGAIHVSGGGDLTLQNSVLTANEIVNDTGSGRGGAVYFNSSGGYLSVTNSTLSNNTINATATNGGALSIINGRINAIDDNTFSNNQAISVANSSGGGGGSDGGAIYVGFQVGAFSSLSGNTFTNNIAQGGDGSTSGGSAEGGALSKSNTTPNLAVMTNNIFDGNQAIGGNGGTGSGGRADGGAVDIRIQSGTITAANNLFINNLAQGGDSTSGDGGNANGGAMDTVASASGSTIEKMSFINNRAIGGNGVNGGTAYGGATEGYWAYDNTTFSGNIAQGGNGTTGTGGTAYGGAWFVDDDASYPSHITIANNQVIAGSGTVNGEALGGGIYVDADYGFFFSNTVIANNTSTPAGGSATANDCDWGIDSFDESDGYNLIEAAGSCVFTYDPTDVTGVAPALGSVADNGCTATLPDGSCVPTILPLDGTLIDQGSCTRSGLSDDERGEVRPYDEPNTNNIDDGCDIGAVEAQTIIVIPPIVESFDPAISKIGVLGAGEIGLPGETITWTITVSNNGTLAASDVVMTDTLVAELTILDVTTSQGSVTVSGQTVTVAIGTLNPADTVTIEIVTMVVASPTTGEFINTATVTGGGQTASATATLTGILDLPATGYAPHFRW